MILETIHTKAILKELPTDGHSPLLVMGSNYEMYVAKNDKGKVPAFSLINEYLASFFLNKWQIESPKIKLIKVAKELVMKQMVYH